jgi:hypothetical protein
VYDIPRPEVLDPDRLSGGRDSMAFADHRDAAARLTRELRDSCAYGQALWDQLEAVRRYLVDSLPRPVAPGGVLGGASPTGRTDEAGWRAWIGVYAAVVATLEGPRRDSGFALDEARQIARSRLEFSADQQPTLETIERR